MFQPTVQDIQEYRELECKNISLEEFSRRRLNEKIANGRANNEYRENLKVGLDRINTAVLDKPQTMQSAVARCIIIDGANIMHCGSPYDDNRNNRLATHIPDVAALLSVLRYFIVHDFDVFTVISRKYLKPDATNFAAGIEVLVKNGICVCTPHTNLDDTVALEFAAQVNGVVITSDQFRDHASISPRYEHMVNHNRLGIVWSQILTENLRNSQTKKGGDYVANRVFKFAAEKEEMSVEEVSSRLYVHPDDINFEISKERYELSEPTKKKDTRIALLNRLIMEALSVCPTRAREILETPVHDPAEARRVAMERALEEEDVTPEEPRNVDSQDEYVAEMEESEDEW